MKHLLKVWKIASFLALLVCWVACKGTSYDAQAANDVELKRAHQKACGLQGDAVISMSKVLGEDCLARTARLNDLVATDADCKAYFGDRKVKVSDVCD